MTRQTTWPLTIEAFDRMPRAAREALSQTAILGNGSPRLRVAKAPGAIMAERIRRADAMFSVGSNIDALPRLTLDAVNAVLQGRAR